MTKKKVMDREGNDKSKLYAISEAKVAMIQMLLPLAIDAIKGELQNEVASLAGERYKHDGGTIKRWGSNKGSVYLGNQKTKIQVPRIRDIETGSEISLKSYNALQNPRQIDDSILSLVINGISTRKYERAASKIPETFGIKSTTISRKFIKTSSKKLKELLGRELFKEDIVAILVDGKTFADSDMIIALGINLKGEKIVLGFIEAGTENNTVIERFMRDLVDRGLSTEYEILFIIDGAKGLYKGIKSVFKEKAIFQRCQWHKRENVVSYLPKLEQQRIRTKLQNAYNKSTYHSALLELDKIKKELRLMNESAVNSLEEGLEETLTLHKLGLIKELGRSLKTTNCIENLNKQLEQYTGRVCYWKNSNQRQRWVATALLEIEPRLNKIGGHKYLAELRKQMMILNVKAVNKTKLAA